MMMGMRNPLTDSIHSVYCASRSLFGLALEGKAPKFLTKCLNNGVPIYSVVVVLLIALLSFLQVSSNTATVLGWFVSLITASQVINYCIMAATYICFYRACKAQGIDRRTLPYRGLFQPYAAWYACGACFFMAFFQGYTVFLPGLWDVSTFLFRYVCMIPTIGYK
jgi:yeast amino acid transporter